MILKRYVVICTILYLGTMVAGCSSKTVQNKNKSTIENPAEVISDKWEGKIYPTTLIGGIDVSGKTKEEAVIYLQERKNNAFNKQIILKYGKKSYQLDNSALNAHYNVEEAVDKAFYEINKLWPWKKEKSYK